MKKQILSILLITVSLLLNGCALVSPFKPINSCKSTKNNGANCASVESNLEYSINHDKAAETAEIPQDNTTLLNVDNVKKDEIARLISDTNIEDIGDGKPIFLQSSVYRVLVLPYSGGDKFYSARYVYITAGIPRWVSGNKVISGGESFNIDLPETNKKPLTDAEKVSAINITMKAKPPFVEELERYSVTAYYLNCRDIPSANGKIITVLENAAVIESSEKIGKWLKTNYYGVDCYVNSLFLEKRTSL